LGQGAAQEPPHDAAAEESVVGAALLSPQAIEACADLLAGPEFYRPSLGLVWREALAMWRDGLPVDVVTLHARLEASGTLSQAGGKARLHELALLVPATANVRHHAQRVRDCWMKRQTGAVLAKAHYGGDERDADPGEVVSRLEKAVLSIGGMVEKGSATQMQSASDLSAQYRRELADPPSTQRGIATPFRWLRRLQSGAAVRARRRDGARQDGARRPVRKGGLPGRRLGRLLLDRDDAGAALRPDARLLRDPAAAGRVAPSRARLRGRTRAGAQARRPGGGSRSTTSAAPTTRRSAAGSGCDTTT
jgi:hypothetical protein